LTGALPRCTPVTHARSPPTTRGPSARSAAAKGHPLIRRRGRSAGSGPGWSTVAATDGGVRADLAHPELSRDAFAGVPSSADLGTRSWAVIRPCAVLGDEQERVQQVELGRGHEVAVVEDPCPGYFAYPRLSGGSPVVVV